MPKREWTPPKRPTTAEDYLAEGESVSASTRGSRTRLANLQKKMRWSDEVLLNMIVDVMSPRELNEVTQNLHDLVDQSGWTPKRK